MLCCSWSSGKSCTSGKGRALMEKWRGKKMWYACVLTASGHATENLKLKEAGESFYSIPTVKTSFLLVHMWGIRARLNLKQGAWRSGGTTSSFIMVANVLVIEWIVLLLHYINFIWYKCYRIKTLLHYVGRGIRDLKPSDPAKRSWVE